MLKLSDTACDIDARGTACAPWSRLPGFERNRPLTEEEEKLFYPYSAFEIARTLVGYKVPLVIANGFGGQEGKSPRAASATAVPPSEDHCSLMFIRNIEGPAPSGRANNLDHPAKVRRLEGLTGMLWKSTSSRYRLPAHARGLANRTTASPPITVGTVPSLRLSKHKGTRTVRFLLPLVEDG